MSAAGTKNRRVVRGDVLKEGAIFALSFALTRLALLAILAFAVKGQEFTNDVELHMALVREPFNQLLGLPYSAPVPGAQAPLLGLVEGIFAYPLQLFLSDFYALRLTYIIYETLAALFFCLTLRTLFPQSRARIWALLGFALMPMGWMTSVVMAQDEVISEFFLALVLWLFATERRKAAVFVCGLGVAAAKIFLVLPLLALILVLPQQGIMQRILIGFMPIAVIYGIGTVATLLRGSDIPLASFTPENEFSISIWNILVPQFNISLEVAKRSSSLLAFASAMLALFTFKWRRIIPDPIATSALIAAMLLFAFLIFYHVNPEYYIIIVPALLIPFRAKIEVIVLSILLAIPWATNFFQGVNSAVQSQVAGGETGRSIFVKLYEALFPISPTIMFNVSLWAGVLATLGMAIAAMQKVLIAKRN